MKHLLLLLLLGPTLAQAQARRIIQTLQLWPEAQAELTLKNGDYLLLALRGQRETEADYAASPRRLGFDQGLARLGYEHFWTEHRSWGATASLFGSSGGGTDLLIPEVLLRHRSPLGPLAFGQRLSLERAVPLTANQGGSGPPSQTNARLRFDLEKLLPLGPLTLRPRLSYEAMTHIRLRKEAADPEERAFQFTSLRAEVGCRVSSRFDFTPWFAYQTTYYYAIESLDSKGQVVVPAGPVNQVAPVVGLDLRFTLGRDESSASQRPQLPTQH